MKFKILITIFALLVPFSTNAVELKIDNQCGFPVWMTSLPNHGKNPLVDGLIKLDNGANHVYRIPREGWAGRLWAKIGCDSNGRNCQFGDSVPPCPPSGCQPPADTKVEFYLPSQPPRQDSWYDISLVDGYSLPMKIVPRTNQRGSCKTTLCKLSLDRCPQNEIDGLGDLRVIRNGKVLACLAPCKKWNYPPPWGMGKSEKLSPGVLFCCPTPPITPQTCRTGPVVTSQYVKQIHAECPTAYSYAYDDEAGLHNCPGDTSFDVTMCPK